MAVLQQGLVKLLPLFIPKPLCHCPFYNKWVLFLPPAWFIGDKLLKGAIAGKIENS